MMLNAEKRTIKQFADSVDQDQPPAFAQADHRRHCPLTESTDYVVYVDEQRVPRSDSMDSHGVLNLLCFFMT